MSYHYTSNKGYTTEAVELARGIMARDSQETPLGAARRAVAVMRHGDKVDVQTVVRKLGGVP